MTDTSKEPKSGYWYAWYAAVLGVLLAFIFLFRYLSHYYGHGA